MTRSTLVQIRGFSRVLAAVVVAAVEVAYCPMTLRHEDFGVVPADGLLLNDDVIRWSAPDGNGATRDQPEHVRPLISFANHQIS